MAGYLIFISVRRIQSVIDCGVSGNLSKVGWYHMLSVRSVMISYSCLGQPSDWCTHTLLSKVDAIDPLSSLPECNGIEL